MVNKQRSSSIPDRRYWRGLESEGRGQDVKLIGDKVANGLGLRRGNLVNIQTGSTVHWRLAFIAMGTMQGHEHSKGMSKSETGLQKPQSG